MRRTFTFDYARKTARNCELASSCDIASQTTRGLGTHRGYKTGWHPADLEARRRVGAREAPQRGAISFRALVTLAVAALALLALMVVAIDYTERQADCEARGAVLAGRCPDRAGNSK